jgi:crotonobetainyl-CoA:carnitine CoA-transferase CaiB-like acyl-CoA transferase
MVDLVTGQYSALAITAALRSREVTGKGARLEVSLFDSALAMLTNQAMSWLLGATDPPRLGNDHPNLTPYGVYQTSDGPFMIAAGTDGQYKALCTAIGRPDLVTDPRFVENKDRLANRAELHDEMDPVLLQKTRAEWAKLFDAVNVPCGPVRTVGEALESSDARTVTTVRNDQGEEVRQVMLPIKIDGEYLKPYLAPPNKGQHSKRILGEATPA